MNTSNEPSANADIVILLISGSCCMPWLAVRDKQAQQVIQQALADTGIAAVVKIVPVSSALQGGIPPEILNGMDLQAQRANLTRLPALFINGKLIGFGVPEFDQVKSILLSLKQKTV
jgi:hypothetical protein